MRNYKIDYCVFWAEIQLEGCYRNMVDNDAGEGRIQRKCEERLTSIMNQIQGQMTIEEYVKNRVGVSPGCSGCICRQCLFWWSDRCPYGGCWDDHRAQVDPYDRAHPDKPPRRSWSNWDSPGEQEHWCRGGIFYPIYFCQNFVAYEGQSVKSCLKENVSIFQDGYIRCGLVESVGCERCYEDFMEKEEGK